jgi:hypothetical protein
MKIQIKGLAYFLKDALITQKLSDLTKTSKLILNT